MPTIGDRVERHSLPVPCIFCYKNVENSCENDNLRSSSVQRFFNVLEKLFEQKSSLLWKRLNCFQEVISLCEDCRRILESFCAKYDEIKCLELYLRWKLETLRNVMQLADKVPSRVKSFRERITRKMGDENDDKDVREQAHKHFQQVITTRQNLIRKWSAYLANCYPKVSMEKYDASNLDGVRRDKLAKPQQSSNLCLNSDDAHQTQTGHFIGWALSFVAVTFLCLQDDDANTALFSRDALNFGTAPFAGQQYCFDLAGEDWDRDGNIRIENSCEALNEVAMDPGDGDEHNDQDQESLDNNHFLDYSSDSDEYDGDGSLDHLSAFVKVEKLDDDRDLEPEYGDHHNENTMPPSPCSAIVLEKNNPADTVAVTDSSPGTLREDGPLLLSVNHNLHNSLTNTELIGDSLESVEVKEVAHDELEKEDNFSALNIDDNSVISMIQEDTISCEVETLQDTNHEKDIPITEVSPETFHETHVPEHNELDQDNYENPTSSTAKFDESLNRESDTQSTTTTSSDSDPPSSSDDDDSHSLTVGSKHVAPVGELSPSVNESCGPQNQLELRNPPKAQISSIERTIRELVYKKHAKFKCSVKKCRTKFHTQEELDNHSKLHGSFSCSICKHVEKFAPDLALHEAKHKSDVSKSPDSKRHCFSCARCVQKFYMRSKYENHFLKIHLGICNDKIMCPICPATFSIQTQKHYSDQTKNILNHYKAFHGNSTNTDESSIVYKCDKCPAFYLNMLQLDSHKARAHSRATNKGSFRCQDCDTYWQYRSARHAHRIKMHKIRRPFLCSFEKCGQKFETALDLEGHKVLHRGNLPILECSLCGKRFRGNSMLKRHMDWHQRDKERRKPKFHSCSQCPKTFRWKHWLESHMTLHTDQQANQLHDSKNTLQKQKAASSSNTRKGTVKNVPKVKEKVILENKRKGEPPELLVRQLRTIHKCSVCHMTFSNSSRLQSHQESSHKNRGDEDINSNEDSERDSDSSEISSGTKGRKGSDAELENKEWKNGSDTNTSITSCSDSEDEDSDPFPVKQNPLASAPKPGNEKSQPGSPDCDTVSNGRLNLSNVGVVLQNQSSATRNIKRDGVESADIVEVADSSNNPHPDIPVSTETIRENRHTSETLPQPGSDNFKALDAEDVAASSRAKNKKCLRPSTSKKNIQRQSRLCHSSTLPSRFKMQCPDCPKKFSYENHLLHHRMCHVPVRNRLKIKISPDGMTLKELIYKKNAKFKCSVKKCKKKFHTQEDLDNHSKLHGSFSCSICNHVEKFAPELALHEAKHTSEGSEAGAQKPTFSCTRCIWKFGMEKRKTYIDHFLETHLGFSNDRIICPICKATFPDVGRNSKTDIAIPLHFKLFHGIHSTGTSADDKPSVIHKCDHCPAYFLTLVQLHYHKIRLHNNAVGDKKYVCQDCGRGFTERLVLCNHRIKIHKVQLHFACTTEDCGRKFETAVELEFHSKTHTGSCNIPVECSICRKSFKGQGQLKRHNRVSHDDEYRRRQENRTFPCDQCAKTFKEKKNLELHLLSHSGPESWQFTCEVCAKKCMTRQKLREHLRTHSKEKPFVCDTCGQAYAHAHNLRIHVNNKHGNKARHGKSKMHKKG